MDNNPNDFEEFLKEKNLESLLESPESQMNDELDKALEDGNITEIRRLIRAGVDINRVNKFSEDNSYSPLLIAISEEHENIALEIVNAGANIFLKDSKMKNNRTPLMSAISKHMNELAKLLAIKGGLSYINQQDMIGVTAIMLAVAEKNLEMIDYLLSVGADVTLSVKGQRAEDIAKEQGDKDLYEKIKKARLSRQNIGCITIVGFIILVIILFKSCIH